jgi:immunoglobulin-binding protein 1
MSLRELAEIETADAMRRQQEEAEAAAKEKDKDSDEEQDDAALRKTRAWDDWKDDNPRGAGNSKLRPCG